MSVTSQRTDVVAPTPTTGHVDRLDETSHVPDLTATQKRNILIAMCTALMAVIASVSGLNVAQQAMAIEFGASQGTILWIINAYTLALAALLMPVGAIGDRYGRKPVLLTGLVVFAAASAFAALSPSAAAMIAARALAGVGAAMIMPVTLSVVTSSFPPEERPRAIGIWAGVAGSGGILGLWVSSFMVDLVTWHWLFVFPIALIAVSLFMSIRYVPNSVERSEYRFDTIGSILSAIGIGGLVLGIHEGPERGWTDPISLIGMILGVAALIGFVWWERRQEAPLLDVSVFSDRGLATGSFTLLTLFGVMFGIFLVLMPYFQAVVGWSALKAAAGMLPMAVMMMPLSAAAPLIAQRFGTRRTMMVGVSLFAAGLATLAMMASVEGGYFSVLPGLLILGVGMGLSMTPSTVAITETLPADKQGVASALNDTVRELGGAVGIALLGSVLSAGYTDAVSPAVAGLPPELAEPVKEGIGGAMAVAAQAGEAGPAIISAAQHAFVDGWVQSMWVGVVLAVAALAFIVVRGPRPTDVTETTEVPAAAPVA